MRISPLCFELRRFQGFLRSIAISRGGRSRKSARSAKPSVIATMRPRDQLISNPEEANTRKPSDRTAVVVHSARPTLRNVLRTASGASSPSRRNW